ncbi:MAG TPA: hypothetical protein VFA45_12625 [Actinomycetes bacterium]|nr:hypothetical protein [Actinomycetes bacterium]
MNVYNLVVDLGEQERTTVLRPRGPAQLNLPALEVPTIDPERATRPFLNLDIETALCRMNIPFALCLTAGSTGTRCTHCSWMSRCSPASPSSPGT